MKPKGFCDIGFAKIDTDREKRKGFPEVVYCPGKPKEYIKSIAGKILKSGQDLLLTKIEKDVYIYLKKTFPELSYNSAGRIAYQKVSEKLDKKGSVALICAGTCDIPIAEEAAVTLLVMGNKFEKFYDVGVAGVHRLMHHLADIKKANVVIVVAGMEGALASLVSGLVSVPVIAVPTSCGYGASFSGLSALLTMLNSCSPGVATVNIDNGFGAGYLAAMINK